MELDPVLIARLQFAFTIAFHIIFPTFTIGLSAYIATLLVMWVGTGQERYQRLARFWTRIFAVSFAMGVVSGIVLSYQFGTNWSRFSVFAGNIVGPLIGYEVLTAFFLEATFLGIMLFGWGRVPRWLQVMAAIVVAVGTMTSAFWILAANSWMHTPTGHEIVDGVAVPLDWWAIIFNPSFPYRLAHMLNAAFLTAGFVVLAVGARYWLADRHAEHARTMMQDGDRAAGRAGAAAIADRRPARAQHAQASADQDRRHGGALGQRQAGRLPYLRLARRDRGTQPLGALDPERGLAGADPPAQRPHHRAQGRGAAEPSAGEDRVLRLPHHARHRLLHDRGGADRGVAALARHLVRDALVPAHRLARLVDRVRRRRRRLGGDRERPPALGGAGHAADRRCDLAAGGIDGAHLAGAVRDRLFDRIRDGHLLYQPTDRARAAGPRRRAARARFAVAPAGCGPRRRTRGAGSAARAVVWNTSIPRKQDSTGTP